MSKELEEIYKDYENRLYKMYAALSDYLISLKNLINTIIIVCCGICCFITILYIKFKKFTNVILVIDFIIIMISILLLILFKMIKIRNAKEVYNTFKAFAISFAACASPINCVTEEKKTFIRKCSNLCNELHYQIMHDEEINKMGVD